jgi:hypothetical protein
MRIRGYFHWSLLLLVMVVPRWGLALEIEIQGVKMETLGQGDQCILIAGEYPGVRIEPSQTRSRAKICYDNIRQDLLIITDATFISTTEGGSEVEINFSHGFPPGPNRKLVAHARMKGFFATATGVGVSTGAHVELHGTFGQSGNDDPIGEGVSHTVGEDIDSGLFKQEVRERYLAAGERTLKGRFSFRLMARGDKLVIPNWVQVDVQSVTRIQEKFQEAEEGFDQEFGEEDLMTPFRNEAGEQPR